MSDQRILILYGTQTGNSQDVAKRIGREAKCYGLNSCVQSIHAYDVLSLPTEQLCVFVVATTGQGDVPDKMQAFWKFIFRKSLKKDSLRQLKFAVFGLGDSAYVKFNVVAKKLHNRLCHLGAQKVVDRGLGDEQDDAGFETALDPWLSGFWNGLKLQLNISLTMERSVFDESPFIVHVLQKDVSTNLTGAQAWFADSIKAAARFYQLEEEEEKETQEGKATTECPFYARVKANDRITAVDHFQDTRHLMLDISGSSMEFSPGDVLAMHPLTPWESVDRFLKRLGLDPHAQVTVESTSSKRQSGFCARSLVQGLLDIDGASPRRFFFEVLSHFAENDTEKQRLLYLSSSQGREEMALYNRQSGRTVLEVLSDFPSAHPPLQWLLDCCPRKVPRKFSIASSLKACPNEIQLTVAIVEYKTKARRLKHGLCTSHLAQLMPGHDDAIIPCWIERGSIEFERASASPLLMIGPGTGVAPFRSILQERHALRLQDMSYSPCPSHLFFGCRNQSKDFYYESEWNAFKETGVLEQKDGLVTAFSRDQKEKIYVTRRLLEHRALIFDLLLNRNAYVYIAGSANKMPNDVHNALLRILTEEGTMSQSEAEKFLKQLEATGRYQVESWS